MQNPAPNKLKFTMSNRQSWITWHVPNQTRGFTVMKEWRHIFLRKRSCYAVSLPSPYPGGRERKKSPSQPALCVYVCVCVYSGVGVQPMDHLENFKEFPAVEKVQVALGSRIMKAVLYSGVSEQSMQAGYLWIRYGDVREKASVCAFGSCPINHPRGPECFQQEVNARIRGAKNGLALSRSKNDLDRVLYHGITHYKGRVILTLSQTRREEIICQVLFLSPVSSLSTSFHPGKLESIVSS